jgi:hypothetical protein
MKGRGRKEEGKMKERRRKEGSKDEVRREGKKAGR